MKKVRFKNRFGIELAFDPSFGGESGGEVRGTASPEIFAEDYSAAVDYIGLLEMVDRERIGAIGICGLSGMAITAAGTDTRIKAVVTLSMYDMSRDMSKGHMDYYTKEQRNKIKKYLGEQRWKDAESGTFALGNHAGIILEFSAYGEYQGSFTRPLLLIAGENAHSRYYSEDAYTAANEPKELVIVPEADHVDLYDNMGKIPFDKLERFFKDNLK